MPILRERVEWRLPDARRLQRCTSSLSPEEQASVRAVLRELQRRYGSDRALAKALGASHSTLTHALGRRRVTADLAVRTARLAGASIDEVLGGWLPVHRCPMCGQKVG